MASISALGYFCQGALGYFCQGALGYFCQGALGSFSHGIKQTKRATGKRAMVREQVLLPQAMIRIRVELQKRRAFGPFWGSFAERV
eukprot:10146969-Prorocentrum_lima.AAC.1